VETPSMTGQMLALDSGQHVAQPAESDAPGMTGAQQ
jgi:hypothetical protein